MPGERRPSSDHGKVPDDAAGVLSVLDQCARAFTFPMLDNGYVYLAATRLSVFGDGIDWAMVIEVFGYSPRFGLPDLNVHTFGSRLVRDRDTPPKYFSLHPNDEVATFFPLADGPWIEGEDVAPDAMEVELRGVRVRLPDAAAYAEVGISLVHADRVAVFELCRFLAAVHRAGILGTAEERRSRVPAQLPELLVLDEWHHPDLVNDELPSDTETFRQLAAVVTTADPGRYRPTEEGNTHWRNWPEGGLL